MYTTACGPSVPVTKNGECRRHTKSETPGVTWLKILQGLAPSTHHLH